MKVMIIAVLGMLSFSSFASEVDQFTSRYEQLDDVALIINKKANDFFQEAVVAHNKLSNNCDEEKLYDQLKVYFSNHKNGKLVQYILYDKQLPKRRFKVKDSIYGDFSISEGYLLGKKSADESEVALGLLIQMGPRTIGSDKFEHLFGRGFVYFTKHYLYGRKIENVLTFGERGEASIYGGTILATGVFSYADLTANFNGMRFWNNILALRPDILGHSFGPYVICKNNQYVKVKDIDFLDYFDDGVDEAINCSKFASKRAVQKVKNRISQLKSNEPENEFECPVSPEKIPPLLEKYGEFANRLINKDGHMKR